MYKMSDQKLQRVSQAEIEFDDANYIDHSKQQVKKCDASRFFACSDKKVRKVLPDGFGFTEDTYKFRLPEYQPTRKLDPRRTVIYDRLSKKDENGKGFSNQQCERGANIDLPQLDCISVTEDDISHDQKISNTADVKVKMQHQSSKYPKSLPGQTLDETDLEQDIIIVDGVVRKTLKSGSDYAPDDFIFNSKRRNGKLIAKKAICIPHICSNKLEYDEFGAQLYTYKVKERDGTIYYHHIFVKVEPDGPAKIMGIEENDELVLLLGRFVPDVKQMDVDKLFHKVKVDGKTRFVLVIRRERDRWIWLELSAILAPETGTEVYPILEKPKRELLKDNCHQYSETAQVYKVPGTQFYLQISNEIVSIDIMNDRRYKSKIIWKRVIVCQADDTGEFKFEASLSDATKKLYITIDNNKTIILNSEPQLFDIFGAEGDKVRFGANGMYLGYNRDTKQVRAQLHTCVFEEFPARNDSGLDKPDGRLTNYKEEDQFDGVMPHQIQHQISSDSGNFSLSPQIITDSSDSDRLFSAKTSQELSKSVTNSKLDVDFFGHDSEIERKINDQRLAMSYKRYIPMQQFL